MIKIVKAVLMVLLTSLFLKVLISYFYWLSETELEVGKCPACYGISLCSEFDKNLINLNSVDLLTVLMNIIGSKNVRFGLYNDNIKIVLKKLGHTSELESIDEKICKLAGVSSGCYVNEKILQIDGILDSIGQYISVPFKAQNDETEISGLHFCPTVLNLKKFLNYINLENFTKVFLANIWTIVMINPEPLIIQVLREEDGWPVPKYFGACGRVVVQEYVGKMLTTYHDAPWLRRVSLAHQLLVAAHNFTNSHPDFGFYLTDMSSDNIAVDAHGRIKFIDLENVIVVDKMIPEKDEPVFWKSPHESEVIDCDGCFAFSPDDICSHSVSDHNFYSVCEHLLGPSAFPDMLPGGLLHDVPPAHAKVSQLLQQCSAPTESSGRFTAAHKLISLLADILKLELRASN